MTTTLFLGGSVATMQRKQPHADWVLVDGDTVAATGTGADRPHADRTVDLDGGVLVPGFCDPHVHLTATGLTDVALDLTPCTSVAGVIALLGRRADTEPVLGVRLPDSVGAALTRHDLDAAVGDRFALLAQTDLHTVIVSSALWTALTRSGALAGDDGTGVLRESHAAPAWRWLDSNLDAAQRRAAVDAAVRLALSRGVTEVHEMFVVEWAGWASFDVLASHVESAPLRVYTYAGSTDVDEIVARGSSRAGGDLFLDGSFGSCTAWLNGPYLSGSGKGGTGLAYRSDEELFEFFSRSAALGLHTGVHAIGDAAIEQAIRTWEAVAREVGDDTVRAGGHRLEHFEYATDDHIRRAARLGLRASVQPAFDRYWGGPAGLYAERIGWPRAQSMNRFRSMRDGGMVVGAGSDSTVTPLDPLFQIAALRQHHVPAERMDAWDALYTHTRGSHLLGGDERGGLVAPGEPADFAVLDADPVGTEAGDLDKVAVSSTWVAGRRVWPE